MKSLVIVLAVLGISNAQHWNNPNWAAGPAAQPGLPQDTPEVAAAKAAHFAALAKVQPQGQQPQAQWGQQPQGRYQGPLALPPGFDQNGAPLPVQDTPEVAAEKAKHFNLVGGFGAPPQNQWNPAQQHQQWNAQPQQQWNPPQQQWNAQPQQQWNAQPQPQWNAQPQWNQNAPGLPQDTPEVAAAKAAHLAAHAQHGRKRRSLVVAPYALTAHTALLPTAHAALLPTAHLAAPALLAHW
ncbi:hypothetical protein O3M35_012190 [Rhynocoris fuscipes]|uniref:Uncharacterized protein n=1 Tax=Rhynocoris fuscipes TaxID=488301 RepID=A0AAW1CVH5_9HEMI